jgi:CubicO group peptidase (beta-lactamase class C family)
VLGEVISGVTGIPIVEHLETNVLAPLGMADSSFATRWPDDVGPGYEAKDGRAEPMKKLVPSVPAAGGLVTTTRDLGRFVAGWRSLLPADLAAQATAPQVPIPGGGSQGFGWIVGAGAVGHAGGTLGHTSSLLWRADGTVNVLMTNRTAAAQDINVALQA